VPFCLTAPPTPTLFGVFAFYHRRLPFITGVCTPSIRCFYNSSLSILACIGKVFACCLHQEHKRLLVVQTLTVSALSFIWEHFFSLHLLSHYSTSLDPTGTPAQSPCALVQFLFSRFLPISDTSCWGIPAAPCADRGCSDLSQRRVKHTDTIFNVVRQIAYIHGRESILLEIRERIQKYM